MIMNTKNTMNTENQKALVALFETKLEKFNAHYNTNMSVDEFVEHFILGVDTKEEWTVENAFIDLDW
jgi:hypothetical protein